MSKTKPVGYACPRCKRPLQPIVSALQCSECDLTYPIIRDIPDFLPETHLASIAPNYRDIKRLEFLAPIYEGRLWHSLILTMAAARSSSLRTIASFISDTLIGITGAILDVACGPATYGRRVVSSDRSVHGIDFSMGTLQQGLMHIAQEGTSGIELARARVEELPFENCVFDAVICGGSLHLFPDTALALREIARTMKTGAPLAVTTFVAGNSLLSRLIRRRKSMHVFQVSELRQYLTHAGFEGLLSRRDGDFIMFSTQRGPARA